MTVVEVPGQGDPLVRPEQYNSVRTQNWSNSILHLMPEHNDTVMAFFTSSRIHQCTVTFLISSQVYCCTIHHYTYVSGGAALRYSRFGYKGKSGPVSYAQATPPWRKYAGELHRHCSQTKLRKYICLLSHSSVLTGRWDIRIFFLIHNFFI